MENPSLREVSKTAGISASRTSQIQRMIEVEGVNDQPIELIVNCKVKN